MTIAHTGPARTAFSFPHIDTSGSSLNISKSWHMVGFAIVGGGEARKDTTILAEEKTARMWFLG